MTLLHIVARDEWETNADTDYAPSSLASEGFIHLSTTEQVVATANRFYRGQEGLVLLEIASERLTRPLRFDDVPGHGIFPHLYGPLNRDAVVRVLSFEPEPDGSFKKVR